MTFGADPVTPYLTYHTMNRLIAASESCRRRVVADAAGIDGRVLRRADDGDRDVHGAAGLPFPPLERRRERRRAATSVAMNTPRQVEAMLDRVPYIAPAGVANAAGSRPRKASRRARSCRSSAPVSRRTDRWAGNPLTQALGCVTVKSGDRILPLFFVSPSQINVQLPDDMPLGRSAG